MKRPSDSRSTGGRYKYPVFGKRSVPSVHKMFILLLATAEGCDTKYCIAFDN